MDNWRNHAFGIGRILVGLFVILVALPMLIGGLAIPAWFVGIIGIIGGFLFVLGH